MAKTFVSYAAAPYRDHQIQITAYAENTADDPLGLAASESAVFGWTQDEEGAAYLVNRGCDPIHALMMVGVAARGFNSIEVYPSEGRVEILGGNKHFIDA
jgi:hypothetical protein